MSNQPTYLSDDKMGFFEKLVKQAPLRTAFAVAAPVIGGFLVGPGGVAWGISVGGAPMCVFGRLTDDVSARLKTGFGLFCSGVFTLVLVGSFAPVAPVEACVKQAFRSASNHGKVTVSESWNNWMNAWGRKEVLEVTGEVLKRDEYFIATIKEKKNGPTESVVFKVEREMDGSTKLTPVGTRGLGVISVKAATGSPAP